jgi:hypothetical protein
LSRTASPEADAVSPTQSANAPEANPPLRDMHSGDDRCSAREGAGKITASVVFVPLIQKRDFNFGLVFQVSKQRQDLGHPG